MAFSVRNCVGANFSDPDLALIDEILAELDEPVDPEHPDVALLHETEWCLSAFPNGLLVWENVEGEGPRHMTGVSLSEVRRLWLALSVGDLDEVESMPWMPGYI